MNKCGECGMPMFAGGGTCVICASASMRSFQIQPQAQPQDRTRVCTCGRCGGIGWVNEVVGGKGLFSMPVIERQTCPVCGGKGVVRV